MSRHPWKTRVGLLALVNALAGVGLALGFATDQVDVFTAAAVAAAALLADLGILRDGEAETTPVDDPLGRDGMPLVPYTAASRAGSGQPVGPDDDEIGRLFATQPNPAAHTERGAD